MICLPGIAAVEAAAAAVAAAAVEAAAVEVAAAAVAAAGSSNSNLPAAVAVGAADYSNTVGIPAAAAEDSVAVPLLEDTAGRSLFEDSRTRPVAGSELRIPGYTAAARTHSRSLGVRTGSTEIREQ